MPKPRPELPLSQGVDPRQLPVLRGYDAPKPLVRTGKSLAKGEFGHRPVMVRGRLEPCQCGHCLSGGRK